MINCTLLSRRAVAAVAMFALAAPVAVFAQDATATPSFAPAKIILTAADGANSEYTVSDISIYLSTSPAYDDVPATTDLSLSLSAVTPIDASLLKWAAQVEDNPDATRDLTVVAMVPGADGADRELRYEISDAHVNSVSTSNSNYAEPSVTLSVLAGKVVIDGVAMN